jgi:3-oxoacyl-[acyl-carrier-protein] synthase II
MFLRQGGAVRVQGIHRKFGRGVRRIMTERIVRRVVITGMGMTTSLGPDLSTCWRRLLAGDNGIGKLSFWDPSAYTTKVAAEVRDIPELPAGLPLPRDAYRRGVRLFLQPVRDAFHDAGLDRTPLPPGQIGIAVGTSVNYLDMALLKHYFQLRHADRPALDLERFKREGRQPENSFFRRLGDVIASAPARLLQLSGPAVVCDTACAASAHAVCEAYRLVRSGKVQAMVAGGSAALVSPISILAFALLGALSRNANPDEASRPFDRKRDGFVMGEGAGVVILESLDSARERGAHIHAELAGCATTLNAHNLTDPSPDGVSEARAMSLALRDAALEANDIDYIAAHGTSTPKNDVVETSAIKRVFGARAQRLLISSNKGQIGHTIAAAGVLNLICAVKAIASGVAPPTMHLHNPDPECDLDYVANRSRPAKLRAALVNAFAFGGQNAVLAVRAYAN